MNLLLVLPFIAFAAAQQAAPILVSTEWLAQHVRDDRLVVLHVGNEASYAAAHIPGARLLPFTAFAPERDGLSTEMPDAAALRDVLEAAGVSNDSRIIVYTTSHPPQLAARLYVTLDRFGLGANTSILDGGLRAWRAEDRAVTTEPATVARGTLQLRARDGIVVDHKYVHDRAADHSALIVDARDTRFWTGDERNQQRAARAGRIPGAHNIVFSSLVDDSGRLLDRAALSALFTQAGVSAGQPIVTYCHVGQQASLLFVAARLLGHDVRLYDGSFEDWSRRTDLPVETGASRERRDQ
jgi:thiosulfate/3-mercaptopyruvate sulfurtransferase